MALLENNHKVKPIYLSINRVDVFIERYCIFKKFFCLSNRLDNDNLCITTKLGIYIYTLKVHVDVISLELYPTQSLIKNLINNNETKIFFNRLLIHPPNLEFSQNSQRRNKYTKI